MTEALRTVTAHLVDTERLVDRYTTASARIRVHGIDDVDIDELRQQVDDAVLAVVTEWECIGRPGELLERIIALPGAHQATIAAAVDPDTNSAFDALTQADSWRPTPLDDHGTPPPFPLHTLPNWAQDHAQHVADQIQVPVDLTAMLIIGALSAACTGRAKVKVSPNWSEPVNLYLVTAMDSGAGKSAAEKLTCQWLRDWQQARMDAVMDDYKFATRLHQIAKKRVDSVSNGVEKGSQTNDDLIHALRELDEAAMKIPELPRILADDATPEAVATLLAAHGERLAIMSTEADLFDLVLRGKTGARVNFNVYLKAWSGDSLIRDRKGGSDSGPEMTSLRHPLMTVACTVQPSVLARLHNDEEMSSRGFSARFMASMPESLVGKRSQAKRFTDAAIPTTDTYDKTATALADRWATWELAEVPVEHGAAMLLQAFLDAMEPQIGPTGRYHHLSEWTSKLYGSIARYAGLLHLAEGRSPATPIDADTMRRALDLGRYWLATADLILSMGDQVLEQARAIKSWIDRNDVSTFKIRDLQRHVQRKSIGLDVAVDYVPALEHLIQLGWVKPSDPDWVEKVGMKKTSAGDFAVWSPPPRSAAYVGNVGCRSMGERDLLSLPTDTPTGGPVPTPDIPDTHAHGATDPPPVDNPTTRPPIDLSEF